MSAVRVLTEAHGAAMLAQEPGKQERPDRLGWKEARLALAHPPGSVTPIFGATLGSVREAGERLATCARKAGGGSQTKIHGVGDGAAWIIGRWRRSLGVKPNI